MNLPSDVEPSDQDWPKPSTYSPQPESFWRWYWRIMKPAVKTAAVMLAVVFCILALLLLFAPARAHDHNRPDLEMWFRQQFSGHGPCCDGTDAKHVSDVEWDTTCKDDKCRYRVFLYDKWWDVAEQAVVYGPNLSGTALVWAVPTYDNDKVISVFIRCFMPGAGG